MELPKRRPWIYWTSILSMLLLLVGVSVYLALFVDWRPPDPRPQQLEGLYRLGSQAQIEANEKVSDSGKLRLQAQETWSLADKTIDSLVLTIAQIDDKQLDLRDAEAMLAAGGSQEQIAGMQKKKDEVQQSLAAAEGRLAELRKQAQENIMLASTSETDADRAANDVKVLRLESDYYKQQEEELKETIAARPDDREPAPLPMFDRDKNKLLLNETVSLSTDWTENYFRYFSFPDIDPERFFATYDTSRRFSGEKALRITSLEAKPIRILFPESKNAAADLSAMKYLSFALRFPEMTDSAAAGTTLDAGKIGEIRVRFCNSAGYVDIQTISPRFCEAVFYDGRGKFVAVDVPLTGDSHFWKRSENVDMKKFERRDDTIDSLLTRSVAQASLAETTDKEPTFFSRIDWIELRFIPLTNRTTFWIDGMLATEKRTRDPYDLLRAESSQAEQRKREAERLKNRRPITMFSTSERPPSKLNTDEEVEFHDEDSMHETDSDPKKAPDSQSKAGKDKSGNGAAVEMLEFPGTEEERIQRVLRWALQTAKGRARIVAGGERLSLGPKSKIPASIDLVEELDVAGFNRMTETDIDLICSLKGLKRLNLARTGLQNPVTAKLAVLNSLEYLNLAGNQLTFDALKPLQTLAALTDLNLDGIALSEKGIESLAMLKNLKTLSLNRSMVGSGDLLYLAPLAQLETLSLTASKVGNRGLQYLKTVPSLKTLDLSKTDVSDPGMPSLVELKNLQTLIVDGTALTDACLNDLARIPKLTIVSAVNTKITAQGVRQTLGGQWIDRIKTDTAP